MGTEPQVFASLPLAVMRFAVSIGLERGALLAAGGLSEDEVADPDALVPYESLIGVWQYMLDHSPPQPLGLRYAASLDPSVLGVVGYACTHARNLRESTQLYLRYLKLIDPFLRLDFREVDGLVHVALDHEPRVVAMREPIEAMIVGMVHGTHLIARREGRPEEVCFRHEAAWPVELYEQVFDAPVRFGAAFNGVIFDAALMELPFPDADPRMSAYLQKVADGLLADIEEPDPEPALDAQLRSELSGRLEHGDLDQDSVARALGMSARSLQRGLKALGTTYSAQLDEVRRTRALGLLRKTEATVQEVAFLLGYAEPATFFRSFRRWTGQTPTAYRHRDAH